MMRAMDMAESAASVPIETGELGFNVTVQVQWELIPGDAEGVTNTSAQ
jgi:uncharacterized protein YggE